MVLGVLELEPIIDAIQRLVFEANRRDNLEELLEKLGLTEFLQPECTYDTYKEGRILVVGNSEVDKKILLASAEKCGVSKARFEFVSYDEATNYNFKKLQYNPNYRVVMFGATPHSASGKGDSSSIITAMENQSGYPKVIRMIANDKLKITKKNFKETLYKLLEIEYI